MMMMMMMMMMTVMKKKELESVTKFSLSDSYYSNNSCTGRMTLPSATTCFGPARMPTLTDRGLERGCVKGAHQ
eukprot:7050679-Prorocentrum_lima.AAC.1